MAAFLAAVQTRPSVVTGQLASALGRTPLHWSSICTASSRWFRNQSSICGAGVDDNLPEPARSAIATISLLGSLVQPVLPKNKPEHNVISTANRDVIV
jgi:hypothetical protein